LNSGVLKILLRLLVAPMLVLVLFVGGDCTLFFPHLTEYRVNSYFMEVAELVSLKKAFH
jgi:hypothetical protein